MTNGEEVDMSKPSLAELQTLAVAEEWDAIDHVLQGVADNDEYLGWAETAVENEDPNLRDLAISLFEKSSIDLKPTVAEALTDHMRTDENPYVRFRSAFALFQHGSRDTNVINTIKRAPEDEDVANIAQSYLDQQ